MCELPDGVYSDKVYGRSWKVAGGRISGELPALTSAIIY